MPEVHNNIRVTRFRSLDGLAEMLEDNIAIAGVGSVGRQIAMTLATMGAKHLTIYDPDIVEAENFGPQGYDIKALGNQKVMAMALDISRRNPDCELSPVFGKYPEKQLEEHMTLFICVDSMESRYDIAKEQTLDEFTGKTTTNRDGADPPDDARRLKPVLIRQPLVRLIDTRMACMAGRLITDLSLFDNWRRTLFPDSEAAVEPCSLRMTTFGAQIMAGLAVHEYMALLQGRPPVDLHLDIMARAIVKDPHYIEIHKTTREVEAEDTPGCPHCGLITCNGMCPSALKNTEAQIKTRERLTADERQLRWASGTDRVPTAKH